MTTVAPIRHAGSPAPVSSPSQYSTIVHSTMVAPVSLPASVASSSSSHSSASSSLHPVVVAHPGLSAVPGKYNGYADLPNQVSRRSVRKGFALNVIVVGETGTGKSTFINSLFSADIYDGKESPGISYRIGKTIQVEKTRVSLVEKGVKVRLTIVDVPGFGHFVDNTNAWDSVVSYIDRRYHEYLEREMSVKRNLDEHLDDRVHCCLYFIAPNGHGMRPLDILAMKALGTKVNVIPVIGRADTLTVDERKEFKEKIRRELKEHDIKLYDFPENSDGEGDDEDDGKLNGKKENFRSMLPFAVIGSNTYVDTKDGRKVRGRKYPWGTVEIDNPEHSDFTLLRKLLLRIYLSDLMDVTNDVHYENYRCEYFNRANSSNGDSVLGPSRGTSVDGGMSTPLRSSIGKGSHRSPLTQLELEQKENDAKIMKMKSDMQAIFDQKVKEKELKLADSEKDLEKKFQNWERDVDAQRKRLEQDKTDYELQKKQFGDAYPQLYPILQDALMQAAASDTASSGGSPGGNAPASTILKKPAKTKKSFLDKGFL
ncbi:septin-7-like isoform X2 [Paramacrobiotus metropolitanus]|uniref:septin-7-like isoform X2 n=1 Tax=Paramacrobiotus metropolitanus TaxID=2943436 RepID=UPI00244607AE|nr:septin-7-like isoform X2 [Paramacrobiotus metropolitanus]